MRDGFDQLQALGVEVLGVSFDPPAANKAWHDKNAFPFRLLSDTDKKMAIAYGAAADETAGYAKRISYVLDENGKVLLAYPKVVPAEHLDQVVADVKALGEAAPQE